MNKFTVISSHVKESRKNILWRRIFRRKRPGKVKWLCAEKPVWSKSPNTGKFYWKIVVKGEKRGRKLTMVRSGGRNRSKRPKKVVLRGKRLRWC